MLADIAHMLICNKAMRVPQDRNRGILWRWVRIFLNNRDGFSLLICAQSGFIMKSIKQFTSLRARLQFCG
jgi:hypothetical protein